MKKKTIALIATGAVLLLGGLIFGAVAFNNYQLVKAEQVRLEEKARREQVFEDTKRKGDEEEARQAAVAAAEEAARLAAEEEARLAQVSKTKTISSSTQSNSLSGLDSLDSVVRGQFYTKKGYSIMYNGMKFKDGTYNITYHINYGPAESTGIITQAEFDAFLAQ